MWWNRKEESNSNGYSSTDDRSDDYDDDDNNSSNHRSVVNSISNTFRTSSVSSKKSSRTGPGGGVGSSNRQSFLGGSKSLVPNRRSRRNQQNNKKQRSKSFKEIHSSSSSNLNFHGGCNDNNLENTVAETYMGFEVSLASLTASLGAAAATATTPKTTAFTTTTVAAPSPSNSNNFFRSLTSMKHAATGGAGGPTSPSSYSQSYNNNNNITKNPATTTNNNNKNNNNNNPSPSRITKMGGSKHTTSHHRGVQMKPVISFQEELVARQKIHRTQYTVTQWPALRPTPTRTASAGRPSSSPSHASRQVPASVQQQHKNNAPMLKLSRHHRVQYGAAPAAAADTTLTTRSAPGFSFDDCLFLLRSHEVVDEMTCLKEELKHLDAEIDALQKDTLQLEEILSGSTSAQQIIVPQLPSPSAPLPPQPEMPPNVPASWDVNELLGSRSITVAQRSQLLMQRGINLTVHFHDRSATEALATRCGIKNHILAKYKETHKHVLQQQQQPRNHVNNNLKDNGPVSFVNNQLLLELTADTCREGGAATHIQQVALLCKDGGRELSFFLGRDQGKSVYWGHLPDRLYRRMQDQGMNPKQSASELSYLATGPMDYYYAEFRSGEAWWGSSVEDRAFHSICTEWDVYRVAFGPCLVVEDDAAQHDHASTTTTATTASSSVFSDSVHQQHRQPTATSSWVVLSRDGRAAWKNIPSRLDRLLQSRMANQAGVAEVSLGCGDSYFCRFLDGTVDYCLPSTVAAVCQQLERKGSTTITSIALHPELSHDFVIRSATLY
ncbi:hypothetical protein ACA910_013354 [Epithemia clementina (nom. ined.)]